MRFLWVTHRNIYVKSHKAAERVFLSVTKWIEKNLKIPVNRDKSDTGHPWERQFLGYKITKAMNLMPSPKAFKRFKLKVRAILDVRLSQTSKGLRDSWKKFITGWCNYYSLCTGKGWRNTISGWIRRHIRKCFWLRWHSTKGRKRNLKKLGVKDWQIKKCNLAGASWPMAKHPVMNMALDNATLRRYGFLVPSDFVGK